MRQHTHPSSQIPSLALSLDPSCYVMEAAPLSSSVVTTGNKGDLTPFLEKIYDIVNDPNTDEIVSWSSTNNSFVVWNPTEFACFILPTYFKHNNFSSFTRQLNTYVCQLIFLPYSLIHLKKLLINLRCFTLFLFYLNVYCICMI
jgi:hypothetical protein